MTNHILKNDGKMLHTLFQKLAQLHEFNQIFAQYVEPAIVAHCKVANLHNNCLIVIVDSGNWATQLRFQIPDLIQKMRKHPPLQNLKAICCKTRPDAESNMPRKKAPRTMKQISVATANSIKRSAASISDPKLREILEKIAAKAAS